jgi:TolB protein
VTRETKRVTNNDLYEDAIALSHDRKKIAFHAWTDRNDPSTLDIYTINIDGTGLKKLTDNRFANAHPSWSPDDTQIIYSPIYHPEADVFSSKYGRPPIIKINADNGSFVSNLTPHGIEDSDAEWLMDGRIVAKSSRFSPAGSHELKIISMNGDGTNVKQISFKEGVVDHDPSGDPASENVLFERFPKNADHSGHPDGPIVAWDIVQSKTDGSGETTLISDPWLKALPVYDPTGQYFLYKRGPAFLEAVLANREGKTIGRLIPNITSIGYIDWK